MVLSLQTLPLHADSESDWQNGMELARETSAICVNKNSGMSVSLCGFLVPDSGIQQVMRLNILGGGEFKCE